jgi:tellurite resistance protein TehA-like permease
MSLPWTVVMATGIVSVSLELARHELLSRMLLAAAGAVWVALVILAARQLVRDRRGGWSAARSPTSLSVVAGTAVLGSRLLAFGSRVAAVVLLALAAGAWLSLSVVQLRRMELPRSGSSFMLTVALQSLAALSSAVSASTHAAWLTWVAVAACIAGVTLYPLALARFDLGELRAGRGDQWIVGGAIAITTLVGGELSHAVVDTRAAPGLVPVLHTFTVVAWAVSASWLLVLLGSEFAFPRLGYDQRRWSTVFPVGMYAACSFEAGRVAALPAVVSFAQVWTWVAVVVWAVVAVAAVSAVRRTPPVSAVRRTPR